MPKSYYPTVSRSILKVFAAELQRLTNFPLTDKLVDQAVEATMPKLKREEKWAKKD